MESIVEQIIIHESQAFQVALQSNEINNHQPRYHNLDFEPLKILPRPLLRNLIIGHLLQLLTPSGGGEEPNNISSLLQPALMNSLPLTSYALLLDMLNRQAAAGTNASQLASHLNQIQVSQIVTSTKYRLVN